MMRNKMDAICPSSSRLLIPMLLKVIYDFVASHSFSRFLRQVQQNGETFMSQNKT